MTLVPVLSDREFEGFQGFIHREAGIWLGPAKKALLVGRLGRRVRELRLESFGAYRRVAETDAAERVHLLDCITTNETRFFREPRQFEFLAGEVVPRLVAAAAAGERPRRIRAWSAACSTGEEPYSIAMTLLTHCPPAAGWQIEVLATDLSTRVLATARAGVWPMEDAAQIPEECRKRFMLRGVRSREGTMKARPELLDVVKFERLNLAAPEYPVSGRFDLVFCRNVLIYFDPAGKERVLGRLRERTAPGGFLFLGHAESMGQAPGWRSARPNVYARSATAPRTADDALASGR
jgi:chemotaxis protein methyltransferase CheR